jgi:hypothetical protein
MSSLLKQDRIDAAEASVSATERRIADRNHRIVLDLMLGRDTSADEEKVARDLTALARMPGRHGGPGRPARR